MQEGIKNQAQATKAEKLVQASKDLEQALQLFNEPELSLGLSYKDLLVTCAHHPSLVNKLLETKIEGIEQDQTVSLLLDGKDLTLLGSVHIDVMKDLLARFPDKINGADLLAISKNHPSLAMVLFKDEDLSIKLSGRQLAELGALDPKIAQTIKDDEVLWTRITTNKHVDDLVAALQEEKKLGNITPQEFMRKMLDLLKEDKTYMHVGVLCQNNPKLAQQLYKEGFLDKLNGEDLSYFVQFHDKLIDKVFKTPSLLEKLEGNDFRRLGVNCEKAALNILNSDELMKKSGPHVWASLGAAHPSFLKAFLAKYDSAVRTHLSQQEKFEKTHLSKHRPKENDLLRFDAQFMIELASKVHPQLAEFLYEEAVNKKNPVSRYILNLDDPKGIIDVEKALKQLKLSLRAQGVKDKVKIELQLMMTRASLEARNAQLQGMKYVYMTTLAGVSPKLSHQLLDNIEKFPNMFKDLVSGNIRALAGKDEGVILRVLKIPQLAAKLSSAHLANMALVSPRVLDVIWSDDTFRQKIINNRSVPILCGKYLNIIEQAAENKGYMDEIVEEIKSNKNIKNKEVPKGYVWYLYNILYPHAEITAGIKSALAELLDTKAEKGLEETVSVDVEGTDDASEHSVDLDALLDSVLEEISFGSASEEETSKMRDKAKEPISPMYLQAQENARDSHVDMHLPHKDDVEMGAKFSSKL